jgi:uncharacterized protein YndB with AHSA1/START domain
MRIEHEHEFDVPLEPAFAYITRPENWPEYWPGIVRVEPGSRWRAPGEEARIVVKLLGRDVELKMRLRHIEPNRLVEYRSVQDGLPDARHERRFEATDTGFRFALAVEYEPRAGVRGAYDRAVVRRGIERAMRRTVHNLERALPRAASPTTPRGA